MSKMMIKNVYLVLGHQTLLKTLLKSRSPEKPCSWIYLGKDVCNCIKMEKIVGIHAERLSISEDLQEYAKLYRKEYIDYIGQLSLDRASILWFFTSLSEKNPFISDFFLNFCYLKVSLKYIHDTHKDLIIVCENRAVINALLANIKEDTFTSIISFDSRTSLIIESLKYCLIQVKNKSGFLFRYIFRIILARLFSIIKIQSRKINSDDPLIIIHSWTDYRSFPKKEIYTESYLGSLCDDIKKQSKNFFYLADVLPTLWYPKALYNLIHVKDRIYLMEEFLSIADIFTAVKFVRTNYPKYLKNNRFDGLDVSAILNSDLLKDRLTARAEQSYLNYFISERISQRFSVRSFLFTFENHIWEKSFCYGFKKSGSTKLIAYAIIFINRMYTCFSVSKIEKNIIPQPDIIIVSGEQGKEILVESGFDSDKIAVGGAIRYPNIANETACVRKNDKGTILIALTGVINQSLELLFTSIKAFSDLQEVNILIKCHPLLPFNVLSRYLPELPAHFHVVDGPIGELLKTTDLVVYTESTVSVEALAKGVPLLHVKSEHSIDINIFDDVEFVQSSADPLIIAKTACEFLSGKKQDVLQYKAIVNHLFSPVNKMLIKNIIFSDNF